MLKKILNKFNSNNKLILNQEEQKKLDLYVGDITQLLNEIKSEINKNADPYLSNLKGITFNKMMNMIDFISNEVISFDILKKYKIRLENDFSNLKENGVNKINLSQLSNNLIEFERNFKFF